MSKDVLEMEERLRVAMLTSNVAALDHLIDGQILFVGPDGGLLQKADDLEMHRSGTLRFSRIDVVSIAIEEHGETVITSLLAILAGIFHGNSFEGSSRYQRTWIRTESGWKVVAGSISHVQA